MPDKGDFFFTGKLELGSPSQHQLTNYVLNPFGYGDGVVPTVRRPDLDSPTVEGFPSVIIPNKAVFLLQQDSI